MALTEKLTTAFGDEIASRFEAELAAAGTGGELGDDWTIWPVTLHQPGPVRCERDLPALSAGPRMGQREIIASAELEAIGRVLRPGRCGRGGGERALGG